MNNSSDSDTPPIVFKAVIEKVSGFGNRRLKRLYVMSAPHHLLRHVIATDDNGMIERQDVGETLSELLVFGYSFTVIEPEVLSVAPILWFGDSGDEQC